MGHIIVVAAIVPLMGCAAAGPAITGLATAGVAGTVGSTTGSAAAGIAAGVAVSYGIDQGVKYGERRVQDNVQSAIATTSGPLDVGQSAAWQVPDEPTIKKLPFEGRSGTVEVARSFGQAIPCKDVIFTVDGDHGVYTTTVCRNDEGAWLWAAAEPSIHRWGYLQ
jgi:hypothetical protein